MRWHLQKMGWFTSLSEAHAEADLNVQKTGEKNGPQNSMGSIQWTIATWGEEKAVWLGVQTRSGQAEFQTGRRECEAGD